MVRDAVELFLEIGGEVVFDIAREEAFEESRHEPALVLGHEALLLDANVFAVAQHGQRRGVGGGAADAQLLHALHQRRLGEARRRLGEMLVRPRCAPSTADRARHRRQAAAILVLLVVLAFLIELQEAVETHDLTGGAQIELAARRFGGDVDRGALQFGDSIWLAMVRVQIRS
jgi:hypothetical protein